MRVATLLVLHRFQTGHHVQRLRGILAERALQPVIHALQRLGPLNSILGLSKQVHHFGEIFGASPELKIKISFHLIEKVGPGAGIERRALHQRGLDRLGQKMAFECPDMLDPRTVLRYDGVPVVERLQGFIAELDEFQFEEGQMLPADGAQFALKGGMLGLDRRVGQVRALP